MRLAGRWGWRARLLLTRGGCGLAIHTGGLVGLPRGGTAAFGSISHARSGSAWGKSGACVPANTGSTGCQGSHFRTIWTFGLSVVSWITGSVTGGYIFRSDGRMKCKGLRASVLCSCNRAETSRLRLGFWEGNVDGLTQGFMLSTPQGRRVK